MKKLSPSGYIPAEDSKRPGYLQRRMAAYRMRVALEKEAAERALKNVRPLKREKA